MTQDPNDAALSRSLRQFLSETIDSLEQLDILVRMSRSPRFWSAADLAAELLFDHRTTERALEVLAQRGLLEVRIGTTVLYRFAPANAELSAATALADYYPAARVEVVRQTAPRRRAVRDFADAFNLRKRDRQDR